MINKILTQTAYRMYIHVHIIYNLSLLQLIIDWSFTYCPCSGGTCCSWVWLSASPRMCWRAARAAPCLAFFLLVPVKEMAKHEKSYTFNFLHSLTLSGHYLHVHSQKMVIPSSPPTPLHTHTQLSLLPTFSCGYHIPDSHSHDKHRFVHSTLISQQVILWSYAPFGANFLQETNGGFARRNQCHLAGYLKTYWISFRNW